MKTRQRISSMQVLRISLFATLFALPLLASATCPSNAVATLTSQIYGYAAGSSSAGTCNFKTLEEAEYFSRQNSGTAGPSLALAFTVPGALDQPGTQGSFLDYRPNGANDPSSPILNSPPASIQSTFQAFAKNWPPSSVPASCQSQACTAGSCNSIGAELSRMQCTFDATYANTAAHPEFCFSRQGNATTTGQATRLASSSGVGTPSGVFTYAPSSSTANDSGASITIAATTCGGNTSSVVNGAAIPKSLSSISWGVSRQDTVSCPAGGVLTNGASCSFAFEKILITPPSQQLTSGQCGVGNPCFPSNGNKEATEQGFKYGEISLNLYYNSSRQTRPYAYIDSNWSHSFAKRVLTEWAAPGHINSPDSYGLANVARMTLQDEEAHVETYVQESPSGSGVFRSTNAVGKLLKWFPQVGSVAPYWKLFYPDGTVNVFDRAGRLVQVVVPDDPRKSLTLSYLSTFNYTDPSAGIGGDTAHTTEPFWRLARVTDGVGRYISFQYSADIYYWLSSIVADDGTTTLMSFGYTNADSVHRLTQTTQFGQSRTYIYNEAANIATPSSVTAYWLTGIKDELGQRFATYQYDDWGRAIASWHDVNAGKVTIAYSHDANGNPTDGQSIATLPSGDTKTYAYASTEPYRHPSTITNSAGTASQYVYDDQNGASSTYRTTKKTDPSGRITTYEYDAAGAHETARTDGFGTVQQRRTETDWDATTNRVTAIRIYADPAGGSRVLQTTWSYQYDQSSGQILKKTLTDPTSTAARVWTYSYCPTPATTGCVPGLLQSVQGPRIDVSDITKFSYYTSNDLSGCGSPPSGACHHAGDLNVVTNALGQTTTFVSYDSAGRPIRIKDANGTISDMSYTTRGWLSTQSIRANADGTASSGDATTTYIYDNVGNVQKLTRADSSYLYFVFDPARRLTDIYDSTTPANPLQGNRLHYVLDAAGNRIYEQTYDPSGSLTRQLSRQFDQLNQLVNTVNANNVGIETHVNPSDAPPASTDGYDANGNIVYGIDSNGIGTEQRYDALNRLTATLRDHPGHSVSTQDTTTQYAYDARDNITAITDPLLVQTSYIYDGLNNLKEIDSLAAGTKKFTYDAAGNVKSQVDAQSTRVTYNYDALNRVVKINYPDAPLNALFIYDIVNPDCQAASLLGATGRLTEMLDGFSQTTYCYDGRGNLRSKTQITPSGVYTTAWSYDNATNRVLTQTTPNGITLTYGYDSNGRISTITMGATQLIKSVTYYPFGPIKTITFGDNHTLTKTYDQNYQIKSVVSSLSSGMSLYISTDALGNLTQSGATSVTPDRKYNYDPLNRLQSVTDGSNGARESYVLNQNGDRTSATVNAQTVNYSYNPYTHWLAGDGTNFYSADANGNTPPLFPGGASTPQWTYNAANRLSGFYWLITAGTPATSRTATYKYNPVGERISKRLVSNAGPASQLSTYFYDESGHQIGEYTNGSSGGEYVYIGDLPVAIIKSSSSFYYVETDQLGTPRAVIDPARGVAVWNWSYFGNSFGTDLPNQDPDGDGTAFVFNFRFPGQYFDSETGLVDNGFRTYEASSGRYIQSDPIGLRGGINTYAYVKGNPLRWKDPFGLETVCDPAGSGFCWDAPDPSYPPSTYWGWDAHLGYGRGRTSFTCTDECGKKHTYIYKKICVGAAFGLSGGGGAVLGTDGPKCRPDNYAGWFLEAGYSLGPVSGGADFGFNEDGPAIPFTSHRLPGSSSNVMEGSLGLGVGAAGKLTYCYYILIGGE